MSERNNTAWELGWDFALYGWSIPEDAVSDFADGFRAFLHDGKRPTKKPTVFEKKWLQLRNNALSRGKAFETEVTPEFIERLVPADRKCPVTLEALTVATLEDTDWSIERACNDNDYIRGNLIVLSVRANKAKSNFRYSRLCQFASGELVNDRLTQDEWRRLAELVEPMNRDTADGLWGVDILNGQRIAAGTSVSPVVSFQSFLAATAMSEIAHRSPTVVDCYFEAAERVLCRTKAEQRAYRRLVTAVRKRAQHVTCRYRLWGAPRVLRMLERFISTLGGSFKAGVLRLAAGMNDIREQCENHPRIRAMEAAGVFKADAGPLAPT